MKNCERYELLASLVLDGEASGAEQAELAEHLESCPACRAYFEDIQQIHTGFIQEEISVPEGFAGRVMDRVRRTEQDRPEEEQKKVVQFPRWKRWTALAACCAVAVLSVWAVRGAGGVKGDTAAVGSAPQVSMDMRSVPEDDADQDGPAPLFDDGPAVDAAALDETPPEMPEEYEELAKSAAKDGEAEGQYQPLDAGASELAQQPTAAAAPPAGELSGSPADALPVPEDTELDREEPERENKPEPDGGQQAEPEEDGAEDALAPAETEPPEEGETPEEIADEAEPIVDTVEPVEVLGVPDPGILLAYGTAAQAWVENVLGQEWAAGGSYSLTAEQYSDLLRTLDEAGEPYSISPSESYCLMTE